MKVAIFMDCPTRLYIDDEAFPDESSYEIPDQLVARFKKAEAELEEIRDEIRKYTAWASK